MEDISPSPDADRFEALFEFLDDLIAGGIPDKYVRSAFDVAECDDPGSVGDPPKVLEHVVPVCRCSIDTHDLFAFIAVQHFIICAQTVCPGLAH